MRFSKRSIKVNMGYLVQLTMVRKEYTLHMMMVICDKTIVDRSSIQIEHQMVSDYGVLGTSMKSENSYVKLVDLMTIRNGYAL